ncbi:MAG: hypothetical protein LBN06_02515 [Prevotellaceae bacterium]|jgi:hypothetical protein|nr:hypothetical protein [Prevotellaceae bacterium]
MRYFTFENSIEPSVVGNDYPQAYKFIKGYEEKAPNALFSLYKYYDSFPDYEPNLDGIMLAGYAKLTDFVSSAFSGRIIIMSPKAREVFERYCLCPHRFYPLGLYKRKVKYDYFMFFIQPDCSDFVDYPKTTFLEYNEGVFPPRPIDIESKKDFIEKREKMYAKDGLSHTIRASEIAMDKTFNRDLDFFGVYWIGGTDYVSERLKDEIEANNLSGWIFEPVTNLIVE